MKKVKTTLLASLMSVLPLQSMAIELNTAVPNSLDAIVDLPVKSIKAIEANGQIFFVSENGRYVFRGEVYDIWNKSSLDTINQVKHSATRLNISDMGGNLDELNTLTIGKGDKQVVVFVDPKCPICHKLMQDAKKMGKDYTFKFLVVPAFGEQTKELTQKVYCAKDKDDALDAFMKHNIPVLEQRENCDMTNYDKTLLLAHLIDVQGVPFIIAPDGRFNKGRPNNFESWLENK